MSEGLTPSERTALLTWALVERRALTAAEAATIIGMSENRARRLLNQVSRVLPIYTERRGRVEVWCILELGEP